MKKFITAILAIMMCLSFTSCNKKTDETNNKVEVETKNPQQELEAAVEHTNVLTIKKDENFVSLGDSKDVVEKAFGSPTEERQYSLIYEGATVYLDETVNMITVNGNGFTGYGKAEVGMSIDEFREKLKNDEYSVEEQKDIGFYRITVAVDEKGNIIKNPTSNDSMAAAYLYTVTSNNYGKEGTITHIQLKDNRIGD